jgi:3-carboxy-cis,cis-muconate cycloisomerase
MPDVNLLIPGAGADDPDDVAVLRAMLRAEVAWTRTREQAGAVTAGATDALEAAADVLASDDVHAAEFATKIARDSTLGGNPVIPLVQALREHVGHDYSDAVHTGLTSQDVLDTAIVLVLKDAGNATLVALASTRNALARLAAEHRSTPALAHTLSQAALPTTLGARVATWLQATAEAERRLSLEAGRLPVSFGGAAGTLASDSAGADWNGVNALATVDEWAEQLGLATTAAPWHVTRFPMERIAGAFAEVCAATGKMAADVLMGSRPESGELQEHTAPGKGASSAMPFKRNPVLSVTIRRSALAAPYDLAQVHSSAGFSADERPDGAWHAEWEPLRSLARHAVISARCAAQLVEGLQVNSEAVAHNLSAHSPASTPTAHGSTRVDTGSAEQFVDRVLAQYGDLG